ncbi:uridine kinase family protein [Chengkuizengella axinellae]|uniref:Uridine kinase n=1 Tax=Chengkuizengella axinellae TaxID=3064388 RepID=A0ABT9IY97_9BACL|nr:uridine kinase [Chengkuizengella sp. 2205SS18-9]MDP5274228.1 uridine kinase [Chengkuizengella sp. 2205SS18-9]
MNLLIKDIYNKLMSTIEGSKTILIGIDGCGGAGKSTLAQSFKKVNPEKVTVIHMDDFYKTSLQRESVKESDIGGNWDITRVKKQVLIPLSQNQNTEYQRYDWNEDNLAEWNKVPCGELVVIEGCYSLIKELETYYDFKIWIETPKDLRLSRGIERDGEEKRHLWEDLWMPAEELYIKSQNPTDKADLVIDGIGENSNIQDLEVRAIDIKRLK